MDAYCYRYGLDSDELDVLWRLISAMDGAYIERQNKTKKESASPPKKESRAARAAK